MDVRRQKLQKPTSWRLRFLWIPGLWCTYRSHTCDTSDLLVISAMPAVRNPQRSTGHCCNPRIVASTWLCKVLWCHACVVCCPTFWGWANSSTQCAPSHGPETSEWNRTITFGPSQNETCDKGAVEMSVRFVSCILIRRTCLDTYPNESSEIAVLTATCFTKSGLRNLHQ